NRRRATREYEIVVNIEECARAPGRLRRDDTKTIVRVDPRDQVVADNVYFNTECIESLNHPFDVTRCAARLRAWSRRRAQINNSFGWHSMSVGNRLLAPNFFFKPRQFPPRLRHIARASHRFTTE